MEINNTKRDEFKKKKKKIMKMVLLNGALYLMSHFPVFITTILLLVFAKSLNHFCNERISCDLINEIADFFILISMITNFFIFNCFNKCFSESLEDIKKRVNKFFL